ncbi:T9SS type A sorting domain-containing protein [Epilithonimonas zeae]|uniref:DUF7619 domain-containing protein n=1 Tax=Epilithonimonas zeae TaxID=1416779 RepID=UPI00200BD245|nr:T9SS type A sorting domain-containing protein [Epilithonimonas zeae]UQB67672.1 T9SS type A sorting domain-containing protein [Epilithonimonas zeae]
MKTKLLLVMLALFSWGAKSQNINFPDANFKAVLLSSSPSNTIAKDLSGSYISIDANGDGEIDSLEAQMISGLDVSSSNITQLDGLDYFVNLNYINCNNNDLTSLDLSGFEQLSVYCDNNKLTSMNYPKYLDILSCQNNLLTSFNYRGFADGINLSNNLFTTLDFSGGIPYVLNLSNNSKLESINLKSFSVVNTLNIDNSPNLKMICVNESDKNKVQNIVNTNGYINCNVSVACEGNYYINFNNSILKTKLLSADSTNEIAKDLNGNYTKIDINNNGEVEYSEAANISEIKINNSNLDAFDELYYFSNLTSLVLTEGTIQKIRLDLYPKLKHLDLNNNKLSEISNYSPNTLPLEYLNVSNNSISYENFLTKLSNLKYLDISNNPNLVKLEFTQNVNLSYLKMDNLTKIRNDSNGILGMNKTKLVTLSANNCNFISLPFTGIATLENLYVSKNKLSSINTVTGVPNLKVLDCSSNVIESIYFSPTSKIEELYIQNNKLTGLNISVLSQLSKMALFNNPITTISCKNNGHESIISLEGKTPFYNTNFNNICVDDNQITEIKNQLASEGKSSVIVSSDCPNCEIITFADAYFKNVLLTSPYASLDLNGNRFKIDSNHDGEIDVCEALQLKQIYISNSGISSMDEIKYFTNLEYLDVSNAINGTSPNTTLTSLDLSKNVKLKHLELRSLSLTALDLTQNLDLEYLSLVEKIPTIDLSKNVKLTHLDFGSNYLTSIDLTKNINLTFLNIYGLFSTLDLSKNVNLKTLRCDFNVNLTDLDISKNINLTELSCSGNGLIKSLDFSQNTKLEYLGCYNTSISVLDVNKNPNLKYVACGVSYSASNPQNGNALTTILAKNGANESLFDNNTFAPNLKYICVDEFQINDVKNQISDDVVSINTYCSFTPGGNFNTITGTAKIDTDNNGCDSTDNPFEYLKLKIDDGTNSGETFVQNDGKYEFYTKAGNFNIVALAENPTLFTVSPANFSTTFANANNNVFTQDICVTANGSQNDAEVVIAPLTSARPGFDAVYNLVWRNKGNTTLSGKVIMNYDSNKMTFQSSSLPYSILSNGSIEFNYTDLKPFANTASEITFKINTPTDSTNPVNMGDVLAFNAQITPTNADITPEDNLFGFNHTVVNSFDPNDIVCLEGETVPVSTVGKYLHYVINFENTGNAEAENIVVKMEVDPNEFDINTLQLQNASASVDTKIVGNQVEFAFKKIKLQSGGHGNVLLKMKSKSDLVEGDTVNNVAEIYFDYNFPIETNDYVTTIYNASDVLAAKINYSASNFSQNNYPINFDASLSTGNITGYQWEFLGNPSISSSTDVKPVVTYNTPGNYTAKLTVFDSNGASSSRTITFSVGGNVADLSTGKNSENNFIEIDADEDDWKGYDINGVEITPKVRHTYTGWSYADIGNGRSSQWITLNNLEGYYTYKSREFTIPDNATDAKLNLRSLSFVRNWTYLVKVNPDGSETETEITKTQWMNDGFKGWLNSRSPKVDNYSLSPGRYYIKVFLYSNNNMVRQSIDVNAIVSCSEGLIFANKMVQKEPTLDVENSKNLEVQVYPIPTKGLINIISDEKINAVEVYDAAGRIIQKQIHSAASKESKVNISASKGIYYLKIKTNKGDSIKKIIKE